MLMATEPTGNLARVRDELYRLTEPAPIGLSDPITDWCMIIVQPSMEQQARDTLRRRGVAAYWPNFQKIKMVEDNRNGGRIRRSFLAPVVPGIVFSPAKFDNLFWNALDTAPGVVNVARKSYGDIIVLNEIDIVLIHKIEQGLNVPHGSKPVHNFKSGEKIRLCDDTLSAFGVGKVIKLFHDGRISIETTGMGRAVKFVVLPHQIRRP
jgi:hypothetical protein